MLHLSQSLQAQLEDVSRTVDEMAATCAEVKRRLETTDTKTTKFLQRSEELKAPRF